MCKGRAGKARKREFYSDKAKNGNICESRSRDSDAVMRTHEWHSIAV